MTAPRSSTQSVADWAVQNIAGTYADAAEASQRLRAASSSCHVIGGVTICPLPEGHEVQIIVIPINKWDCYRFKKEQKPEDGPPRFGIPKATLMTLANAAGVEWIVTERRDDGADPHYAHYRVVGRYMQIDGTYRPIEDERDSDFRTNSEQIRNKSENEVSALRANIVRATITKARLRALRAAFGVAHGMPEPELEKPFVLSKAIFTGRSDDKKVRRLFAAVIAQQKLAATMALYGAGAAGQSAAGMLPAFVQGLKDDDDSEVPRLHAAPTVLDAVGSQVGPYSAPTHGNARHADQRSTEPVWPWAPKKDGDPKRGTPLREVPLDDLTRLIAYCEKASNNPDNQWAARDAALARAAREVLAERTAVQQPTPAPVPAAAPQQAPAAAGAPSEAQAALPLREPGEDPDD